MSNTTALLVVDVQVSFVNGAYRGKEVLAKVTTLIERARIARAPVIYVQHNTDLEFDGPIHPDISPQLGDPVVLKTTPDSFYQTRLQDILSERGIQKLVIAGFQTELSIDTTCRRAWSMDYEVTLVQDAHSTFDFGDAVLTAAQTVAHHSAVLADFATVIPAKQVRFQ